MWTFLGGRVGGEHYSIIEDMLKKVTISPVQNSVRTGNGSRICVGDTNKEFWSESFIISRSGSRHWKRHEEPDLVGNSGVCV